MRERRSRCSQAARRSFGVGRGFGFGLLLLASTSLAQSPLAPVDTSSPHATLATFLDLTEETGRLYSVFRDDPSSATQTALRRVAERAVRLLDLSEVAPAVRGRVGAETYYLLWDVIARIELPLPAEIPDGAAVLSAADSAEPLTRWRIPGTEITISRITDEPRAGEFLFSAGTVADARRYYEAAVDLPYLRPTPIENVYLTYQTITGWMLPPRWIEALPGWANTVVGGQVLWKSATLLLLLAIAATALVFVFRWARRHTFDHTVRAYLCRVSVPVALVVLAQWVQWLARWQINVAGPLARVPDLLREIAVDLAAVWIIWVTAHWVADRIIASPRIPTRSLHANLIRFSARLMGMLAAIVLLFNAAQDVGVPVYGLVAGAGIGGLAVALAVRTTLENMVGTLTIYADRPVQLGDRCIFGEHRSDGIPREGTIEEIGLRSTRIRGIDRSVTTIPNGEFANLHIVNLQKRDRRLFDKTFSLRYETTPDQLELILERLRELVEAHSQVSESGSVQVTNLGPSGIQIRVFAYLTTSERTEFLATQEDLLLRIMRIVADGGSALAYPSTTVYRARDGGLKADRDARRGTSEPTAVRAVALESSADDGRK
jgi:MscS family membrane protein